MKYNYFIPIIHLGPAYGYTYTQILPLERIKSIIIGKYAEFEINRKIFLNNELILEKRSEIHFKNNNWLKKKASFFEWGPSKDKNHISYIETQINLLKGKGLKYASVPGFYVNYSHPNLKNYLSCSSEKYGNPRVISQMKYFGLWVDGYPAININKDRKTTYSIVIVNPYKNQSTFSLEISDLNIKKIVKVPAFSAKKLNMFTIINKNSWTGQFYLYGKRRAIVYVVNHSFDDFNRISTIEHSDPFRAELTHLPRFQYFRNKIHKKIKMLLS